MNVKHPMGVLNSFSIKNIFYDKMDLRLFYCCVTNCKLFGHQTSSANIYSHGQYLSVFDHFVGLALKWLRIH